MDLPCLNVSICLSPLLCAVSRCISRQTRLQSSGLRAKLRHSLSILMVDDSESLLGKEEARIPVAALWEC